MTDPVRTVIGFDYGTHWIGVAIGQTLTGQASPLSAVRNGDWEAIAQIIDEWQPERLIVGLPLDMQGSAQEMSQRAQRFARQLEGRFGIATSMADERLTTREAWSVAIDSGERRSKQQIDSLAAALITETWLRDHPAD
jgi:putative Holliday junction resolvase